MDNPPPQGEMYNMIKRSMALAEDTNKVVHSMRRTQRWHTLFRALWWLTVLGITGAVYYYLLAPYLGNVLQLYGTAQQVLQNFKPN